MYATCYGACAIVIAIVITMLVTGFDYIHGMTYTTCYYYLHRSNRFLFNRLCCFLFNCYCIRLPLNVTLEHERYYHIMGFHYMLGVLPSGCSLRAF